MSRLAVGDRAAAALSSAKVAIFAAPGAGEQYLDSVPTFLARVRRLEAVWILCASQEDVDSARELVLPESLNVHMVDARGDFAGVVGDLFGAFAEPGAKVVALDTSDVERVRQVIRQASGYAGVPFLVRDSRGWLSAAPQAAVNPSLVLGALRFALTSWPTGDDRSAREAELELSLREAGFETLVKASQADKSEITGESLYAPTDLLRSLLADVQLARSGDFTSSCAELLERRGRHGEARKFRELTRYWVEQRLWDANFVPEMVLHNEVHAAAVDRNVASLCEALLDAGELDDVDLLVLAAAAWLHDWGHASARNGDAFPTNPVDVRNFHGLLTRARLRNEEPRHRLRELAELGVCGRVYQGRPSDFVDDVALLCAHHQSWTSCDATSPRQPKREDPAALPTGDEAKTDGFLVRSFYEDYGDFAAGRTTYFGARRLKGSGSGVDPDRQRELDRARAQLRLAILRLADAADVGVHRVPDHLTQQSASHELEDAYLDRQKKLTDYALMFRGDPLPVKYKTTIDYAIDRVGKARTKVDEAAREGRWFTEDELKDFLTFKRDATQDVLDGGRLEEEVAELDFVLRLAQESYRYAMHMVRQRAFYDEHEGVRLALPVLRAKNNGHFELFVYVIPNPPFLPKRSSRPARNRARRAFIFARNMIAREYGYVIEEDGTQKPAKDMSSRAGIQDALLGARIDLVVHDDAVEVRRPSGSPVVPEVAPPSIEVSAGEAADAQAIVELRRAGMAVAPDGTIGARVVSGGVEVVPLTGSWPSRVAKLEEEEISVLAVDGSAGPAGPSCRVLVTWPGGTALVHRGLRGRDRPWHGQPSLAGALLGDRVILVDRLGHARQLVLDQPGASTAVGWLCDDEVGDLDVLATDGSLLVAASVSVDSRPVVKVARFAAGDWEQVRSLAVASQPIRVAWDRDGGDPALLVISEGSHEAIRLDDKRWQFS